MKIELCFEDLACRADNKVNVPESQKQLSTGILAASMREQQPDELLLTGFPLYTICGRVGDGVAKEHSSTHADKGIQLHVLGPDTHEKVGYYLCDVKYYDLAFKRVDSSRKDYMTVSSLRQPNGIKSEKLTKTARIFYRYPFTNLNTIEFRNIHNGGAESFSVPKPIQNIIQFIQGKVDVDAGVYFSKPPQNSNIQEEMYLHDEVYMKLVSSSESIKKPESVILSLVMTITDRPEYELVLPDSQVRAKLSSRFQIK